MPHKCTNCDEIFDDGSKDMLSGCNGCDGRSFEFIPESRVGKQSASPSEGTRSDEDEVEDITDRDWPAVGRSDAVTVSSDDAEPDIPEEDQMDSDAQSRARSVMVDAEDLKDDAETDSDTGDDGEDDIIIAETDEDAALRDKDELRERLNEQFGSIKIVEPGKYSLDLMKMYENEDYIITLGEDGRYAVESMTTWRPGEMAASSTDN